MKWVFLTAIISGVSIFLNKFGVAGINSSIFTLSKNLFAGIFLVSIVLILKYHEQILKFNRKDWLILMLIGLFGGSIPFILFFNGLQIIPAAQAAFIHKTLFIWVGILALLFLKEKLNKKFLIASALLIVGNFLLLNLTGFELGLGAMMILVATLFWAVENIIAKYALKKMRGPVVACGRMLFGSLFILIYLVFTGELPLILELTATQLGWIVFTSLLLFTYVYTWYTGLEKVPVSIATNILLLGSPITTLLSIIFTGVSISLIQAAGLVFVLLLNFLR
jgi:drug/metabolite transporter (DMT)-like permease